MPCLPTPWLDGITPDSISPSYCSYATVDGVIIARDPYVGEAAQLNVGNNSPPTSRQCHSTILSPTVNVLGPSSFFPVSSLPLALEEGTQGSCPSDNLAGSCRMARNVTSRESLPLWLPFPWPERRRWRGTKR